ncbi:MAG: hypothetical protein U0931_35850 [Vulcanimicrobiota bacterium]
MVVAAQQRNAEMRSQIAARFEALGASLGGQVPAAAPAATSTPVDDNSFLGALTTRAGNVLAHLEQGRQALVDVTSRGMQYVADNSAGQMALDYLTYQMRGGQAIVNAAADAGGRALDAGGRALDYLSRSSAGQIAQDFNQAVVQPVVSSGTNGGRSVVDYLSNTSGSQMVSDYVDLYGRVVQGGVHAAEVVGDTVLPIRSLYNTVERMGDAPPRPGEGVRNSIELAANLVGVVTAPLGLGAGGAAREATEVVAASTAREAAAAGGREAAGAAAGAVSREATEVAAQRTIAEGAGLGMSEAGAAERSAATLVERPAASAGSAGERSATGLTSGEGAQAGAGQPVHSLEIPPAQQPGVTNLSEWQTTGEGRWRTYTDSEGVLWKEQETKGISSRLRLGGFDGLSEEARAVGSQELRPMVHPNGANISFEVAGLPKGDARVGFVQEALDHMAPEARLYAQRVFASERIGQSLDELGRVIPGSEVAGLAGGSRGPQMIIDRARLTSVESAQQMIYHEAGHNFELALARTPEYGGQLPSSRGFWGDGNVVHERALANAAEDFAETHRVVVQNWNEYIGRSAADWASETGTLAEKKLEILRGYGVKVPTQAELEAARALRPATPDILI